MHNNLYARPEEEEELEDSVVVGSDKELPIPNEVPHGYRDTDNILSHVREGNKPCMSNPNLQTVSTSSTYHVTDSNTRFPNKSVPIGGQNISSPDLNSTHDPEPIPTSDNSSDSNSKKDKQSDTDPKGINQSRSDSYAIRPNFDPLDNKANSQKQTPNSDLHPASGAQLKNEGPQGVSRVLKILELN